MNDLQSKAFNILKEFVRVCEKHNLRYFLFGGSLLGAIRHKGFIPWDDDLDICMPRPDFDKLMKLKDEFQAPFFLQNIKTDYGYTYPFAKVRDSSTTFLETTFGRHDINHGIFIDIFPLDGHTKRKNAKKPIGPKPYLMWILWWFSYLGHFWRRPFKRDWFYAIPAYIVSIAFLPFNLFNWMTLLINGWAKRIKWEQATLVGPYLTMYFNRDAFPKHWFEEAIDGEFEGLKVKIPAQWDAYLTQIYGDYMKLPPIEKQVGHHYQRGVSTTVSYLDYEEK